MTGAVFRGEIAPIALTPDQLEAADPAASAWVEASAGTGKTQVLTARVLRLLLTGAVPTRILCLTFTKAAAAEMATRIAQRLGVWTIASDDALRRDIEALGHPETGKDTMARARRLFARVLDAPGGMRIMTIHAFCQSVLQRFPLEADLAPHFAVLDEGEAKALLHQARDTLLCAEAPQPVLGDPLAGIAAWAGEEQFAELVESLVRERGRLAGAIERHGGIEGLIGAIRERHGVGAATDDAALVTAAVNDGAFDRNALTAAARALLQGGKTDKERGHRIAEWLAAAADARARAVDSYKRAYLTNDGDIRAILATKAVEDKHPGTLAALSGEAARLSALEERRRALQVAAATEALARLGAALLDLYERRKREAGALDYDDLVHHTRLLLQRPDLPRWVLFKLDGGIDHVLIDEAQDTNPEQWAVVQALTDEFFAGAGARDGQERTVFAVGDPKQSIFSFQRADPKAFEAMRAYFENKVRGAMAEFRPVALRKSFRSAPPVLNLVDAVFADGPARDGVLARGTVMRHEAERAGEAGLVELWPAAAAKDDEGDIEPWSPPTARTERDAPRARLASAIAERIKSWIGREELKSRGRTVAPGDVMVLVRRRDALVDELVRALKRLQIPVAGVDRMVLTEQLAVMDLMALGDVLLLPEDDLTLAAALKGPLFGFDDDRLFKLCHGRSGSLWAALNACAAAEPGGPEDRAAEELKSLLARADFVGPYALYAELLGARCGRRKLVARLGHDAGDPIDEFLSAALAFEREHEPSLQGFLEWLRAGAAEIKRELDQSGRDEVRIMTVHGAKGLQAPIVILPDTQQAPGKIDSMLWTEGGVPLWSPRVGIDDAIAAALRADAKTARDREYRRLLYVALTRAEDRLYVTGWRGKKGASENCWYDLVAIGAARIPEAADFVWTAKEGGWVGQGRRLEAPQEQTPDRLGGAAEEEPTPPLPDWATRPPGPEPEPPTPLAPSAPDEADEPPVLSPIGAEERRRFRRGLLIHHLLQVLPELPEADRGAAAQALLKRWARDLDETARARLAEETLAVLRSPDLADLFGPEGRAEVPVIGRIGRYVVAGQVDRLVVRPEGVTVVDFKTNRPPPREASAVPAGYVRQMAAYRAVIRRIYPDRPVRCALIWTDGAFATILPDDLLDRADPTRVPPPPPP
jgi:ATP-dependent helicase/nuclease subunit A